MPELRFNTATKDWLIIAADRAKRPEDFAHKSAEVSKESAANCPFCPGREEKTPNEIFAIRASDGRWQVRVVPNAFPALRDEGNPDESRTPAGFLKMNGVGKHEVVIETPEHEQVIATMGQDQVDKIFLTYRERYTALAQDPRFAAVVLFKNHGRGAGTSLHHPHSQIIALPVLPAFVESRVSIAREYYDTNGHCLYCQMIKMEKTEQSRVILETDKFIAFAPFASRLPFETWVLPKEHSSNFEKISRDDILELARVVKKILEKLYKTLGNPDFNYALYSAACREEKAEHFHWNLKIFPRISSMAGFELGSGVAINTMAPEAAAKSLQEV